MRLNRTGWWGLILCSLSSIVACTSSTPKVSLTVPGAPTGVVAMAADAQATVSWKDPVENGGSPIIGYTVTATPGGASASVLGGTATTVVVYGLVNGTSYTFAVKATNSAGDGADSLPSLPVIPGIAPAPPTGVTAVAGNAQATVTWQPSTDSGGQAILGYTVTATPGGAIAEVANGISTTATVTGLLNGTTYTFTVAARSQDGLGAPSTASNAVTPATVPGAPLNVVARAGNQSATVSWTAPLDDGGNAITSYLVTTGDGGEAFAITSDTTATVTGLTNGSSYTFTVIAVNGEGNSMPSAPSNAVTPATGPGAPTGVIAAAGDTQATITWVAPMDDGGEAIEGYSVTASPGGVVATVQGATTTSATVHGLVNGTSYTFTVQANNEIGAGAASAPSNTVTPGTVPGTPLNVVAAAGNAQAVVTWTPPLSNGGSAILSYTVTASPGNAMTQVPAGATQVVVTGLSNGTSYTFTVIAGNAAGNGLPSAPSNAVMPAAVPGAPTGVTATSGNGQATVSWTAPANNGGSPITNYTVTATPGGASVTVDGQTTAVTVPGLMNGEAYSFTVVAINAMGSSMPSVPSSSVTPATVPGTPLSVGATAANGQVIVSWLAPSTDGGSQITEYVVAANPGNTTVTVAGSVTQATFLGLTVGTPYSFTVFARNSVGNGPVSASSNVATPSSATPGAPTYVVATVGVQQALVSWMAPQNTGGSAITGYTVTATPGGATVTTNGATQATVPNLTVGTKYTFVVAASNAGGLGPSSVASNAVTIPGPPKTSTSTLTSSSATIIANGVNTATLTVALRDVNGNGVPNQPVLLSVGGAPSQLLPAVGTTNVDGQFTAALSTTILGRRTVTATSGGLTMHTTVNFASSYCSSGPSFVQVSTPTVGTTPAGVATGDFNADGYLDLAVANSGSNNLSVLVGNGSGGFFSASQGTIGVGSKPIAVVTADFNADGYLDLATANATSNNVSVLLGNGSSGFTAVPNAPFAVGTTPAAMAVGDFNGDGFPDLAVANSGSKNLSVLLGDGTGNFTSPGAALAVGTTPVAVIAADFNGDGAVDLAVANSGSANVHVFLGNGSGAFSAATGSPFTVTYTPTGMVVGDFNGDGYLDLVMSTTQGSLVDFLTGNGNGTFTPSTRSSSSNPAGGVVTGDFSGDQQLDLIQTCPAYNSYYTWVGNGNGNFSYYTGTTVTGGPTAIISGDFNGDGKLDLVMANQSGSTVTVLLNQCR